MSQSESEKNGAPSPGPRSASGAVSADAQTVSPSGTAVPVAKPSASAPQAAAPAEAALLDEARLAAHLASAIPGVGRLLATRKFAGGQSNPTFLLEAEGGRFVLRRKPPGVLLKSAHAVDREFRVMRALAETAVPVPRVRHLCEDESVVGSTFFVMDHVDGRVFFDPRLPDTTPDERAALYDAMGATLAHLHDVDPARVGLADFGRPGGYYARQTKRWSEQYRASETQPYPELDAAMRWLSANIPAEDGTFSIVHGDFRHDNMIFARDILADDAPRVRALIDWELSTLGHPLADLAYQVAQWRCPAGGPFPGLAGIDRAALGIPSDEAYVEAYARRRGLGALPDWRFSIVFALFRIAAILQGVYRRALEGNASNRESGLAMGAMVPLLARLAAEELERS